MTARTWKNPRTSGVSSIYAFDKIPHAEWDPGVLESALKRKYR